MPDFVPRSDIGLLNWSNHFTQKLNEAPEKYNIPAQELAEFTQLQQQFSAAYWVATGPATRTQSKIIAKQAARATMVKAVRQIQKRLKGNHDLTDVDYVDLGLKVRRAGKAPKIPTLTEAPSVVLLSREWNTATVQLSDRTGAIRRRLRGSSGALLATAVGAGHSRSTQWMNIVVTGKTIATVKFPQGHPPGTPVMISVQWISTRGEPGPRAVISTWIAGGWSVAA